VTVAAASENLPVAWSSYEPAYRTAAGTGCGLAFLEKSEDMVVDTLPATTQHTFAQGGNT
jgi:hypothetical protein